ncbi:unnamed protein product [Pylaiella littoralis]
MDSSERLDDLVTRARALFESKHGNSEGCFAAFSPAKINFLGDVVEGSGGLALQITLDRHVMVFGRGRVLPEQHHFPTAAETKQRPPSTTSRVYKMAVVVEGGGWENDDGGGVKSSGGRGLPKWSVQQGKNAGKAVDAMVQDLVFGRKARSKSVHSPANGRGGEAGGSGAWLKSRNAKAVLARNKGGGKGSGGGWSAESSPALHYVGGPSAHSSVHSSVTSVSATLSASSGVPSRTTAGKAERGGGGSADLNPNAATPTQQQAAAAAASAVPPELSSLREQQNYDFGPECGSSGATTTSGSTSTEEGFPLESSGSSSGHGGGNGDGGRGGRVGGFGGGGGGGSDRRRPLRLGSADSPVTDGEASGHGGGGGGDAAVREKDATKSSFSGVIEAASAALAAAAEVAGTAPEPLPLLRPLLSLDTSSSTGAGGSGAGQASPEAEETPPPSHHELTWQRAQRANTVSLHDDGNPPPPPPPPPPVLSEKGDALGFSDAQDQEKTGAEEVVQQDSAFIRASKEVAQAKAEIEEAELADIEAERLRTSRIFCEACPDDGMVEFLAKPGMRGGGGSWKGLMTAVAAEYVHELPGGSLVGIEAVVVSDLPGSAGQESSQSGVWAGSSSSDGEQQVSGAAAAAEPGAAGIGSGGGYGWGGAARCALLMASATFFEEILKMQSFPRMKAMRCFSASLRCGRAPGGDKKPTDFGSRPKDDGSSSNSSSSSSSGRKDIGAKHRDPVAPAAPYALEEVVRPQSPRLSDAVVGALTTHSPAGMRLEDLLAIAGDEPPGAQLVDSKWRTCCHVPMSGPGGAKLAIIIAQPRSRETAQRLLSQAEHKRARGSTTCQAVVRVAKQLHPEVHFLRDVPSETLDALTSGGTSRGQQKQLAAIAAGAAVAAGGDTGTPSAASPSAAAAAGGGGGGDGGDSALQGDSRRASTGGWVSAGSGRPASWAASPVSTVRFGSSPIAEGRTFNTGGGNGGSVSGRKLSPEQVAHARHLTAEIERVVNVSYALTAGDMEAVGRLMAQSRRSAGLGATGPRTRQEPAEPAASKLASMMSLLPGVHGSGLSDGPTSAALGAVVALVDPARAEGILRFISTRGAVTTGVTWGGFVSSVGGGSGIIRTV